MIRVARHLALAAAGVAALALAVSGCAAEAQDPPRSDVGVQLFQLPWTSVATECEGRLGPDGYGWVLLSPAQEHIQGDAWWTSYQPVSYLLESRLGTRDEFADMVTRCHDAGVEVIADAVINHMTGQDAPGEGTGGSAYEHYAYPGLYAEDDFHHCGLTPNDDIADYDSREQVQTCELVNLADLDTAAPHVRETIGAYLEDLRSLGVDGFRIDAAKHIAADDVAAIVDALPDDTRIISEVIRGGGEPVQPEEYTGAGEVFEFTYARDLVPQVLSGLLHDPELADERTMHVPADRAVVFIDNHDTERGEAGVTYRDGARYLMANALMLADDYGTPVVYSGYAFSDRDVGPIADASGMAVAASCTSDSVDVDGLADGDRTCMHASPAIAGLVELRAVAGDAARLPGVEDGDVYGFERAERAFIAVNPSDDAATATLAVGLADGTYCDVVAGGPQLREGASCPDDALVTVSGGSVKLEFAPWQTIAIHVFAKR